MGIAPGSLPELGSISFQTSHWQGQDFPFYSENANAFLLCGLCSQPWRLWKPPWGTGLCSTPHKKCRHSHHSCPWSRLSSLWFSCCLMLWLFLVTGCQEPFYHNPVPPAQFWWDTLTTLTTQSGCFASQCNCNPTSVACTLEFHGCCGNSCYLLLNVMSLQTGSLKKHQKQSVLYLPDSTSFAVAFNIPKIPESYGFAV